MENEELNLRLKELRLPAWKFYETTGSTNDDALQWAKQGAPDSALIVADHQTAGKGRMQRKWITRPGVALAFSQVFLPDKVEALNSGLFPPLAGVAVAEALENLYHLTPRIKWPNDVLLTNRKMCGVLVEASWAGENIQAIVMGVGINVFKGSAPGDDEVIYPATYIAEQTKLPVDRFVLLREILERISLWRPRLYTREFMQAWQSRLAFMGEKVVVNQYGAASLVGIVKGVDEMGNLILALEPGREIRVSYGDVHLREYDRGFPGQ